MKKPALKSDFPKSCDHGKNEYFEQLLSRILSNNVTAARGSNAAQKNVGSHILLAFRY